MKLFTAIIITILLNTALAPAQNTITHSAISFKVKNLGVYTDGTLSGLQAKVHFDPANLDAGTLEASVDVNTLNTNNSSRDEHLKSEDFFDLAHYARITLKSVSFKHKSGNNFTGLFNLTIKDKTKQMEIPFTYQDKGNTIVLNGNFKLNRLDFGVGSNSLVLSNDVLVSIAAEVGK
jgi:polyisoprenoid-binding protein YceI